MTVPELLRGRVRVWVHNEPVDMRKSYDGLAVIARKTHDLLSRDVFLFVSRDRRRAKALFWDGSGLNIWMKRLEQGRLADILARGEMSITELQLFFEGSASVVKNLGAEDLTSRFRA